MTGVRTFSALLHHGIDVPKLSISIRMVATFLGLPSALEAVCLIVKKLSHLDVTDRMMPPPQFPRQHTRALADPAQRRLGISACAGLNKAIQRFQQTGILDCERLPSRASLPN